MEKNIFQLASEYNFDAVFEYYNSGNSINICDEDGDSLFAAFLKGYACYGDIVEDEEKLLKAHDEYDYEFWDSFLSEKKKTPLADRNSGEIVKQIEWFLSNGADINLCDLSKSGMVDTPLSVAVCDEDYYLTEFLLDRGANPRVWLFSDHHPWENYEDWLIEHMDVRMMDSKGEQFENELHIAATLAHYGLDDFNGICISIDKESRTINGHSPQWKY